MTDHFEVPPNQNGEPVTGPPGGEPDWFARISGVGTRVGKSLLLPTLALFSALVVGAFIIAVTDLDAWDRFGSEPLAALGDMWSGVWAAYKALFEGAFGSVRGISETLFAATPLILAGLAVAIGFQAGLFNIGANGQILIGGAVALWIGIHLSLPTPLHIALAVMGAIVGGAIWGGIAGLLKAKTGAHEVITTIMLNFIAAFFVLWLLKSSILQAPGANNPLSAPVEESARLTPLFGDQYRVSIGLLFALAAVAFVHWLLFRSTLGFEFRAAGSNPGASRYAGMNVAFLYIAVMAVSGGLAGIAGAAQTIGLPPYQASSGFAGIIGFDAISLALLGRSQPIGVLWAGLLFGALQAGGRAMQGVAQVPLDLVVVMQALIIVFIAAPELVRAIYRVKPPEMEPAQLTRGWG
jgi:simple sugar transport system permease protein